MTWRSLRVGPGGTHHVDANGTPAYAASFDEVLKFHEPGLAPVREGDLAWHITADGTPGYARRFARTFGFYEGLAAVVDTDGWHHITPAGIDAYRERYAWCGNLQEGRCPIRDRDGAYGHIDARGTRVYEARWRYAGDYRDGIAVVQAPDGRSTHITHDGRLLHEQWFVDLDVFHKGIARARDDDGWMHVDTRGRAAYARRFAAVEPFYNGQARVERFDGAVEVVDEAGATIIELRAPSTTIPPFVLAHLEHAPRDRAVVALVRHSIRGEIPADSAGLGVPLTEEGRRLAKRLGVHLQGRLATLHTSPVMRCVQTAEAMRDGAQAQCEIVHDRLLGDPGAYVLDGREAWQNWQTLGHEGVIRHLVHEDAALPGMAAPRAAAHQLLAHMLATSANRPGVHVFVTHDTLVTATAARLLDKPLDREEWPAYLEGAFFWRDGERIRGAYRHHVEVIPLAEHIA